MRFNNPKLIYVVFHIKTQVSNSFTFVFNSEKMYYLS